MRLGILGNVPNIFRSSSGGRGLPDCVLQAIAYSKPKEIDGKYYFVDRVGTRNEEPLDSVVANFDGIDDYVSGLEPLYTSTPDVQIEFDFKQDDFSSFKALYSEGNSSTGNQYFSIYTNNVGGISIILRNDSSVSILPLSSSTILVNDSKKHNLKWVDNNGIASLWIDGVQDSTDFSYTPIGTITMNQSAIGALCRTTCTNYYNDTVSNLKQSRTDGTLLHWYKLDENDGTTIYDSVAEELFSEKITNGNFSEWTNDDPDNWTISNENSNSQITEVLNGARFISDGGAVNNYIQFSQNIFQNPDIGKTYELTINIADVSVGTYSINNGITIIVNNSTTTGIQTFRFISGGDAIRVQNANNSACDFTIKSISIKEVKQQINGTANNIDVNTFWTTDNDFESFQNRYGYSDGTGDQRIPATITTDNKLTNKDALGNLLDHKDPVKLNAQITNNAVYDFTQTDENIALPSAINLGSDFTIEMRVNFNSFSTQANCFWGHLSTANNYSRMQLNPGNIVRFYNDNNDFISFPLSIVTGTWYELKLVYLNGNASLFLDGTQVGSTQTLAGDFNIRVIGNSGLSSNFSILAKLDYFKVTVSDNEVLNIKAAEGDGTVTYDVSGNNNHGTITNANLSTFHSTDNEARPDNLLDGFSQKLLNTSIGSSTISSTVAYGQWEFLWNQDSGSRAFIRFITDAVQNNDYSFFTNSLGSVNIFSRGVSLLGSIDGYTTPGDTIGVKIIRLEESGKLPLLGDTIYPIGTFALYIDRGNGYELVPVVTGSNPFTNNEITTSEEIILNSNSGSGYFIKSLKINENYIDLFKFTNGTGIYSKVRVPALNTNTDVEGDGLSNPSGIGHNNAESTITNTIAIQSADTSNFWIDATGIPLDKTYDDIVPNVDNYIFANTQNLIKKNIVTIRYECQPLSDEQICQIKWATNTGQLYTTIEVDTLICKCDIIQ